MLWIVVAVVVSLLSLGVATRRDATPEARFGWLTALAVLVGLMLATRLGARVLVIVGPALAWLTWGWLRARAASGAGEPASSLPSTRGPMTRDDALRVLGLREGASREDITNAHRSLIKKVHPDHGGSDLLAQQVNEAKRVLESSSAR